MSLCGSFHCYHVLQNWHKIEDDLMQPEESFCSMRCSTCQKKPKKKKPGRNSAQPECSHNVAHLIMLHTSQSIKKNVCSTSCFWFVEFRQKPWSGDELPAELCMCVWLLEGMNQLQPTVERCSTVIMPTHHGSYQEVILLFFIFLMKVCCPSLWDFPSVLCARCSMKSAPHFQNTFKGCKEPWGVNSGN